MNNNNTSNIDIDQNATNEEILDFIKSSNKNEVKKLSSSDLGLNDSDIVELKEIANVDLSAVSISDSKNGNITLPVDKLKELESKQEIEQQQKNIDALSKDPMLDFQEMFNDKTVLKPFFTDLDTIDVTDSEKERYLRCVLENKIFETRIIGKKTGIEYLLKSKTMSEQDYITSKLKAFIFETKDSDQKDAEGFPIKVLKHTDADAFKFISKLNLVFSIKSINGIDVFGINDYLNNQISKDEYIEKAFKYFDTIPDFIWHRLINIMRIFEKKENLLSHYILSEDF